MAFESGVSTSIADLHSKLITFAVSLGWTNLGTAGTNVSSTGLQNSHGYFGVGNYYNTHIALNVASGYTAGMDFYGQPNTAWRNYIYPKVGPITFPTTAYWFFGTADYLHFVIEDVPGQFWHGALGRITKTYDFPGGNYAAGTEDGTDVGYPNSTARVYPFSMMGGQANGALRSGAIHLYGVTKQMTNGSSESAFVVPSDIGVQGTLGTNGTNHLYANNAFLGRTLLHPIYLRAIGDFGGTSLNNIIGMPQDIAHVKLDYLGGKGVLTLGSDDWYLFPIRKFYNNMTNYTGGTIISTGYLGIAYRRID